MGEDSEVRDVGGDVIGASISGHGNITGESVQIHGNVINVQITKDAVEELKKVKQLTQAPPEAPAGLEGGAQVATMKDEGTGVVEDLLDLLQTAQDQGHEVNEVQAAGVTVSHAQLLMQKAAFAQTEALYLAPPQQHAKLEEARRLLEEARSLEPQNAEVLLQLAKLFVVLTPTDPTDEQELLRQVKGLVQEPTTDAERLTLAQAVFLLVLSGEEIQEQEVQGALEIFATAGLQGWVQQWQQLVEGATGAEAGPPFNPVGRWSVAIGSPAGGGMDLMLAPDGSFQATQHSPMAPPLAGMGGWMYDPVQRLLSLQGQTQFMAPFALSFRIQGWRPDGYLALGSDGFAYVFSAASSPMM